MTDEQLMAKFQNLPSVEQRKLLGTPVLLPPIVALQKAFASLYPFTHAQSSKCLGCTAILGAIVDSERLPFQPFVDQRRTVRSNRYCFV